MVILYDQVQLSLSHSKHSKHNGMCRLLCCTLQ